MVTDYLLFFHTPVDAVFAVMDNDFLFFFNLPNEFIFPKEVTREVRWIGDFIEYCIDSNNCLIWVNFCDPEIGEFSWDIRSNFSTDIPLDNLKKMGKMDYYHWKIFYQWGLGNVWIPYYWYEYVPDYVVPKKPQILFKYFSKMYEYYDLSPGQVEINGLHFKVDYSWSFECPRYSFFIEEILIHDKERRPYKEIRILDLHSLNCFLSYNFFKAFFEVNDYMIRKNWHYYGQMYVKDVEYSFDGRSELLYMSKFFNRNWVKEKIWIEEAFKDIYYRLFIPYPKLFTFGYPFVTREYVKTYTTVYEWKMGMYQEDPRNSKLKDRPYLLSDLTLEVRQTDESWEWEFGHVGPSRSIHHHYGVWNHYCFSFYYKWTKYVFDTYPNTSLFKYWDLPRFYRTMKITDYMDVHHIIFKEAYDGSKHRDYRPLMEDYWFPSLQWEEVLPLTYDTNTELTGTRRPLKYGYPELGYRADYNTLLRSSGRRHRCKLYEDGENHYF